MKNVSVTIQYEESKLQPIRKYMTKKNLSLEDELIKILDSYYTKFVPAQVREYFDMCSEDDKPKTVSPQKQKTNPNGKDGVKNV